MPIQFESALSKPSMSEQSGREQLHSRNIICQAFRRNDGHYDIEAEMRDRKHYPFPNAAHGEIPALQPYHHMQVRLTVDTNLTVLAATAKTLAGPFQICPKATGNIGAMVGLQIGVGWQRAVRAAIGGATGCTHITELMGPIATTALQTIFGEAARQKRSQKRTNTTDEQERPTPSMRGSCLAFADKG